MRSECTLYPFGLTHFLVDQGIPTGRDKLRELELGSLKPSVKFLGFIDTESHPSDIPQTRRVDVFRPPLATSCRPQSPSEAE